MRSRPWHLAAVIGSVLSATAAADTEEVVISAERLEESLPQELSKYGSRVTTLTAEQIANAGADDLAQTLQLLAPSLYVSPKNGPFDYVDVSLQGSRRSDILWLIDGVRINNRLYASTTPLDTIPAHMIERIEILEGGQGLFYGTQAVAGVVNVITKSFTDQSRGNFSVGADGNRGQHVSGAISDAFAGHKWVLYGSNDKADGYSAYREQDYQPSATDRERGYAVTTLGAKYAYDFTDAVRFSATYQHTDADLDFARPYRNAYTVNARDEDLLTAKLDIDVMNGVELFLKGYYHDWDTRYTQYWNSLSTPGTLEVIDQASFWGFNDRGVNALTKLSLHKGFEYYLGYDLQQYQGRDEVYKIDARSEHTQAVFAQVRSTAELFERARFAAGARRSKPSEGPSSTVWNLSGQFDLPKAFFVRANVGTAFRLPSAEELFLIEPGEAQGNPNLKPERSRNLNVSAGSAVTQGNAQFGWEIVGFARDVTDLISTDDDSFINIDDVIKVRGVELALNAKLAAWTWTSSFTYNRSRDDSDLQLIEIPQQLFKASLDYGPADLPIGLTATANRVGTVYDSVSGFGRIEHGGYTVVDLSARLYAGADRQHRLNLRLENAFDKTYAASLGRGTSDDGGSYLYWNLGMPRTLHASYSYRF